MLNAESILTAKVVWLTPMPNKILIVEDEPSIADNIVYALASEGFEPQCCATGEQALIWLSKSQFNLIILDVGLPDINGFELAKTILSDCDIPIVFVTARSDEIDRVVGLELGADDYVIKPFSPRELSARVKAVLRRSKKRSEALDEMPNPHESAFQIDATRLQIKFKQHVLQLSRTEYRLLKLLAESPGRVYTREQLMDYAWEHAGISLERTVDTHIKTIRQKLKAISPDVDPIETHRGVGYSLRES